MKLMGGVNVAKNKNNANKKNNNNNNKNVNFANDQLGENRTECADELGVNKARSKNNSDCNK